MLSTEPATRSVTHDSPSTTPGQPTFVGIVIASIRDNQRLGLRLGNHRHGPAYKHLDSSEDRQIGFEGQL